MTQTRRRVRKFGQPLGGSTRPLKQGSPSTTSLDEKLIKLGARVLRHARYVSFQIAEVAILRNLCADILGLMEQLRPPPNAALA
jgi:hypothetical protein